MDPLFIAIYRPLWHKQQAIKLFNAVMATIEQQFNVKFSYAVEDVASINIENQLLISHFRKR
jgi:hypothetical protein